MKKLIVAVIFVVLSPCAFAYQDYVAGKITNLTAVPSGIMIMVDSGVPGNCSNSPYGWMLISQSDTAMVSTVLAIWIAGKRDVTVYTSNTTNNGERCAVSQLDPAN